MSRMAYLTPIMAALALLWGGTAEVRAATCPPTPSCSTSDDTTVGFIFGTYGCTEVMTSPTHQVTVIVSQLDFDGAGTMDVSVKTSNTNAASGSTFSPWANGVLGTYCLNTTNLGYIFPNTGCAIPFIADSIDDTNSFFVEIRLLDSTENLAAVAVCENVIGPQD